MQRFLYIFPHPDDESFGPAGPIHQQLQDGHEVYLLTLTRGGATKMRFELDLSVEEMGKIRVKEMEAVEETLGLTGMEILDLPDGGMREMDPREVEEIVRQRILALKPTVVVTYAVHGISGHHDHLVCHAVVKRVFLEMQEQHSWLQRLALLTLPDKEETPTQGGMANVLRSRAAYIDCIVELNEANREAFIAALRCYETYQDVVESTGVITACGEKVYFEIFNEDHKPHLKDLSEGLKPALDEVYAQSDQQTG